MRAVTEFMGSFGFKEEPLIIIIGCSLILLGNFTGGMFSNIILSFGGPIFEKPLTKRVSFRFAMASLLLLIIYIAYYHTVLIPGIETAQIIYWGFMVLSSPLLAAIGAQLTYVVFAKKIDGLKKQALRLEREAENEQEDQSDAPQGEEEG